MDYIEGLQSSFGDAFVTLPLLIIGVTFFFGTLTSNTGLLYLFLGQLLLVPAVQFILNEPGRFWKDSKDPSKSDLVRSIKWISSLLVTVGINSGFDWSSAFSSPGENWTSILRGILTPFLLIAQLLILNTYPPPAVDSKSCSMIPRVDLDSSPVYSSPSSWTAHIVFFCSFVLSNALGIYNEPTPELKVTDDREKAARQAKLDERVANRKWISGTIAALSMGILIVLLFFRFKYTPCESGFIRALPGILVLFITGASYFDIVYKYCGVRPADVLGIVQGLINPDLIDNPIVCVGQ
jgi:hypothetical protein